MGNAFRSERPPSPSAKAPCRPAWQTLSNAEMTFFTIISPQPFLYKAGHLCVLTLCKTRCSFWTTHCCEPLAIATFPAGLPPSQHRACLAWSPNRTLITAARPKSCALHRLHGFFCLVHGLQPLSFFLILLYAKRAEISIRILHEFLLFSMDKTLKAIVQSS